MRPFFIILLVIISGLTSQAQASVVWVGGKDGYKQLEAGIAAAQSGDTVMVHSGTYEVGNIIIEKSIALIGIDRPVIQGNGKDEILTVRADGVLITGFTIRNAGMSFIHDNAGIKLDQVDKGRIVDNHFIDNFFAVYVSKSTQCVVEKNVIETEALTESRSGNGIHLWYCKGITIRDNVIQGHRDGIYLEFVEECDVSGNYSTRNLRYGLHFMFSDKNKYWNNTFINNGAGVAVMYSRIVEMWGNTFQHNWGDASFGLLLKDIYDSDIHDNLFEQNTIGLYSEGCSRIMVENNEFVDNGWAVKIMANSTDNEFRYNNFVRNTFDVATNSQQNFNLFESNYWSKYRGYDLDRDGVGDVPFHPVKLFSILVEKNEPALILLRSLFVNTLDIAEEYIPLMTPETLVDRQPLMERLP